MPSYIPRKVSLMENDYQHFMNSSTRPSHRYGDIGYRCHIHIATADALSAGRKIDSHAKATDRYQTLKGALACLIEDCGVQNLSARHDEPDLFDGT